MTASTDIQTPRLADAALARECRLHQVLQFGSASEFLIGEVLRMHAREGLVRNSKIDSVELRPLARGAGVWHAHCSRLEVIHRPQLASGCWRLGQRGELHARQLHIDSIHSRAVHLAGRVESLSG